MGGNQPPFANVHTDVHTKPVWPPEVLPTSQGHPKRARPLEVSNDSRRAIPAGCPSLLQHSLHPFRYLARPLFIRNFAPEGPYTEEALFEFILVVCAVLSI